MQGTNEQQSAFQHYHHARPHIEYGSSVIKK